MNRNSLALLILLIIGKTPVYGASCSGLIDDLKAMKQAQQVILKSLADNHGEFASNLDEMATEADMANGKMPKAVLKSMRATAKAYRVRGESAQKQVQKLDEATASLIGEVQGCLAAQSTVSF
ncbi:MAG TPA: hypothetical protein PL182_02675 [Pseudobdellovibrionaceae bacterium]|nr:hypothetical protein [Pseudobdellovibrionaceae bacterium]